MSVTRESLNPAQLTWLKNQGIDVCQEFTREDGGDYVYELLRQMPQIILVVKTEPKLSISRFSQR